MIKRTTQEAVEATALDLLRRKVSLTAVPGSMVSSLTQTAIAQVHRPITDDDQNYGISPYIHEDEQHDQYIDHCVNTLTTSLNASLKYVRNTVIPEIETYFDTYDNTIKEMLSETHANNFDIRYYDTPAILSEQTISTAIKARASKKINDPDGYITHKEITYDEWIELIFGENIIAESVLNDWLAEAEKHTSDLFEKIWYSFFCMNGADKMQHHLSFSSIRRLSPIESLNTYVGVLITAMALRKKVPSYTDNDYGLEKYQLIADEWVDACCFNIKRLTEELNNKITALKAVVLHTTSATNMVTIYQPAMKSFLDAGGTMEILFGFISSHAPGSITLSLSADSILSKKKDYQKTYERLNNVSKISKRNKIVEYIRDKMKMDILFSISPSASKDDGIIRYMEKDNDYSKIVSSKLTEVLERVTTDQLLDSDKLYRAVMTVFTKSKYYFTDAYFIIDTMLLNDDTEDQTEVALEATMDYLVKHLADQVKGHEN